MPIGIKKKESEINLLPSKGFSETTMGRVLSWVVSTFRVIVIVTELLVMVAFLSRFWLDAQITDQKDEIANKQAAISTTTQFERDFKALQSKLEIYKKLTEPGPQTSKWLNTITSSLPPDVYITSINYGVESGLAIEGASPNEASIQQLVVNIQSDQQFSDASLVELRTNEEDPSILSFKIAVKSLAVNNTQQL